jgi:hypothetical protein
VNNLKSETKKIKIFRDFRKKTSKPSFYKLLKAKINLFKEIHSLKIRFASQYSTIYSVQRTIPLFFPYSNKLKLPYSQTHANQREGMLVRNNNSLILIL